MVDRELLESFDIDLEADDPLLADGFVYGMVVQRLCGTGSRWPVVSHAP